MQHTLTGYLRARGTAGFRSAAKQMVSALALALILPVSAWAYTVVLRGGRRVEMPPTFTATRTTLTYEYAPGIYVTLQVSTIDFAATDRANNEPEGSFLNRLAQQAGAPPQAAAGASAVKQSTSPRRTVTDQDLEASRRARRQSEDAYERRRAELGLPSREQSLRLREEEDGGRANN